ncbi:MAG: helix-turn-helix domain-containing protein, partial [Bacteroidota bacterium]
RRKAVVIDKSPKELLFEDLRQLRKQLAQEKGVPPYLIFSDASLHEMTQHYPLTDDAFLEINGVSQRKLQLYGDSFLEAILSFRQKNAKKLHTSTQLISLEMLNQGADLEEIAKKRDLNTNTIYNHLATLYQEGEDVPIYKFISKDIVQDVFQQVRKQEAPYKLKPIYEALDQQLDYNIIKLALAAIERESIK